MADRYIYRAYRGHELLYVIPALLPATDEQLDDSPTWADLEAARRRWEAMTPAQRAADIQARKDQRAAERAASPTVSLELDNLLDKLGWSPAYATHLLQSYCTCDPLDGYTCDHYEEVEDE